MDKEGLSGLEAVVRAARLCQSVRAEIASGGWPGELGKSDGSPVTVADFGAQAIVCKLIAESFPGDAIMAEEDGVLLRDTVNAKVLSAVTRYVRGQIDRADEESVCAWIDAGRGSAGARYWVLDPIDGTKGFLRHEQYAIALALIESGTVQWGFLACPAFSYGGRAGVVFVAQRGGGARAYGSDKSLLGAVAVSGVREVRRARLVESVEAAHGNREVSQRLREALGMAGEAVCMDSQAKYAAVATGQAEVYLRFPNARTPDYRESVWDHAAGYLVVEEAGGKVSDARGQPLDWTHGRRLETNTGVVATNSHLHERIIESLDALL